MSDVQFLDYWRFVWVAMSWNCMSAKSAVTHGVCWLYKNVFNVFNGFKCYRTIHAEVVLFVRDQNRVELSRVEQVGRLLHLLYCAEPCLWLWYCVLNSVIVFMSAMAAKITGKTVMWYKIAPQTGCSRGCVLYCQKRMHTAMFSVVGNQL